jgi:DNA-binding NarL/FixJ family response regulator
MNILGKKVVLLVEDDSFGEAVKKGIINDFGYGVITAGLEEMAVELFLNYEKIDLILLDSNSEKGNVDLTTAWQILEKMNIPIIFLSEDGKKEHADRLREIPCYSVFLKASDELVLRSYIEKALNTFEKNKNLQRDRELNYQTEEPSMEESIKILHIDPDFEVNYFIKKTGSIIRSSISLEQALNLIKNEEFDLIISEPHNKVILKPHAVSFLGKNKIRILIVDDNPILREGLKLVLSQSPTFDIVGEAANGIEAIDSVEKFHPDLVLMDLSMPSLDGMAATKEIKKQWPETKILILTIHKSSEYMTAAKEAGADGFITKDSSQLELIQSIQDALDGRQWFRLVSNAREGMP